MNISESEYRIIYKNDVYHINIDNDIIRTPLGKEIISSNRELLEQLVYELECFDNLDPSILSLYSLISAELDFVKSENFKIEEREFRNFLLNDSVLKACAGPEKLYQFAKWKKLFEYLELVDIDYPDIVQAVEIEDIENWITSKGKVYSESIDKLVDYFFREFQILNSTQQTAVINTFQLHGSIIYGILLTTKKCSEMEYAVAILAAHCIIPNVFGDITRKEYKESLIKIKQDAVIISEFLKLSLTPNIKIHKLITEFIPNWSMLPEASKFAFTESIYRIHSASSDDYSSYVMLLGKGVEVTLKQLVFDKFQQETSYEFSDHKEISLFLKENEKIFPLAKFVSKEPHFIEFGSMLIILEKFGGKTAQKNDLLKSFFSFITEKLEFNEILEESWIEAAKELSRARNKAAHSDRFTLNEAKIIQKNAFKLLQAF